MSGPEPDRTQAAAESAAKPLPAGKALAAKRALAGEVEPEPQLFPKIRKRRKGPYLADDCGGDPPAEFLKGIRLFNAGELFEQHETLETLWRLTESDIRYLYQGVLLVGIGAYHLTRGNHHGAQAKLSDGIAMLEWFAPTCQRVDVEDLIVQAQRLLDQVRTLGPDRLDQYDRSLIPRVTLLD